MRDAESLLRRDVMSPLSQNSIHNPNPLRAIALDGLDCSFRLTPPSIMRCRISGLDNKSNIEGILLMS